MSGPTAHGLLPREGGGLGRIGVRPEAPAFAGEQSLRSDFPGLAAKDGQRWHYLDTAATAQKPQAVIDVTVRALGADYATVHRGVYARSANRSEERRVGKEC